MKPQDGLTHVVMFSTPVEEEYGLSYDRNYTAQMDAILTNMQNDGYTILDVKFNVAAYGDRTMNGASKPVLYKTLVLYE